MDLAHIQRKKKYQTQDERLETKEMGLVSELGNMLDIHDYDQYIAECRVDGMVAYDTLYVLV